MEFKYLTQAINKHFAEEEKAERHFIKHGFKPSWAEEHRTQPDRGLKEWLTDKAWENYKSGKLDRRQAIEKATARAVAELQKRKESKLRIIKAAGDAIDLEKIIISVEWKHSRTWGMNPTAEVRALGEDYYTGTASGCGYDKNSAAVAEALNKSPAIMKILCTAEENRLKGIKTRKQERRAVIGYGSGYGILPYFEGGVGVDCFARIFNACGYEWEFTAHGKTFNAYRITKKAAGGRK